MDKLLSTIMFMGNEIRVFGDKDDMWFAAVDICKTLGIHNSRDAVKRLDDDEKGVAKTDTLGGMQEITTINEAGVYMLIFRSNKQEAKAFKRWLAHEVLPTIRKYGFYCNDPRLKHWSKDEYRDRERISKRVYMNEAEKLGITKKSTQTMSKAEIAEMVNCVRNRAYVAEHSCEYPYSYDDMDALTFGVLRRVYEDIPLGAKEVLCIYPDNESASPSSLRFSESGRKKIERYMDFNAMRRRNDVEFKLYLDSGRNRWTFDASAYVENFENVK